MTWYPPSPVEPACGTGGLPLGNSPLSTATMTVATCPDCGAAALRALPPDADLPAVIAALEADG